MDIREITVKIGNKRLRLENEDTGIVRWQIDPYEPQEHTVEEGREGPWLLANLILCQTYGTRRVGQSHSRCTLDSGQTVAVADASGSDITELSDLIRQVAGY